MIPVLLRGMLPRMVLVVLAGLLFYTLEPGFHPHEHLGPGEEPGLDLGYLGIAASLANYAALSMLLLLGGFVSQDRREGFYRMYFAHPTRPVAFYFVRWLLALAVAMLAAAVFLVLGQMAAWGGFEGGWRGLYLAFLAALAYGGMIAVLSVVLSRGDAWVALVLYVLNYAWLQAVSLGVSPIRGPVGRAVALLLPPQLALSDVFDGLLRGQVVWSASLFAAGYGVFWLIVAGLLLRLKEWP